jgi:hypothetical protein
MLTISGLGFDTQAVDAGTAPTPFRLSTALLTKAAPSTYVAPYQPAATPGACAPPDVMSEFGCLTPKVLMPGSTAVNQVYICPPDSQPYNAMYCLRTAPAASPSMVIEQLPTPSVPAPDAPAQPGYEPPAYDQGQYPGYQAPSDGTGPSPGMMVTPTSPPGPGPVYAQPKPFPWLKVGAGAIGAGLLVAFLTRR